MSSPKTAPVDQPEPARDPEDTPTMEAYIHVEDPRYPTLVIRYNHGMYGLDIDPVTGDIDPRRRCICSARSDDECACSLG